MAGISAEFNRLNNMQYKIFSIRYVYIILHIISVFFYFSLSMRTFLCTYAHILLTFVYKIKKKVISDFRRKNYIYSELKQFE